MDTVASANTNVVAHSSAMLKRRSLSCEPLFIPFTYTIYTRTRIFQMYSNFFLSIPFDISARLFVTYTYFYCNVVSK